jgi:GNAT superfamily N-acetyltransferase
VGSDHNVRLATPEDEDALLDLALRAWHENGVMDINEDKMRGMIRPALYLWQGLCGVIGEPGEKIEGAVLLRVSQMWYSDSWLLEEKAVFVDPDFRKVGGGRSNQSVGHARRLVEFCKEAADKLGVPLLIGVLSNTRTKAKVRLYERQFGEPAGAFFLYGVKTGHESPTEH